MSQGMLTMLAALSAEVLLVLFASLGASWWRNHTARQRDAAAIQALVARVRHARAERQAAIARFVGNRPGPSGEDAQRVEAALWRAELGLLQRFAEVYRQRDAGAAASFDSDLVAALEPYHALSGLADPTDNANAAGAGPIGVEELERLRAENARLSEELRVTMETMSRMLNEYSTMFAGAEGVGSEAVAAPVAAPLADAVDVAAVPEADGAPGGTLPDAGAPEAGGAGDGEGTPGAPSVDLPEGVGGGAARAPAAFQRGDDAGVPKTASRADQSAELLEEGAVEVVGFDEDIDDILPPDDDGDPLDPEPVDSAVALDIAFDDAASLDPEDGPAGGDIFAPDVEAPRVNSGR